MSAEFNSTVAARKATSSFQKYNHCIVQKSNLEQPK